MVFRNFTSKVNNLKMKKEAALNIIKDFPQEFELELLIEKLIFMEKVEKGLQDLEAGNTKTHDEVKELIKKW